MRWIRVRFRLHGTLHVGARKWGYVRSCRPYLPGWTLWGAMTNFLKRTERMEGGFPEVGSALNRNFWFGHLALAARIPVEAGGGWAWYLPGPDENGSVRFGWRNQREPCLSAGEHGLRDPLAYRHGVVRNPGRGADTEGNLYLTEAIDALLIRSYWLEGWVAEAGDLEFPLQPGDPLVIGGNRTAGGGVAILDRMESMPQDGVFLNGLTHLSYGNETVAEGELERVVLRRTKEDGGFGAHVVDWKLHLKPGWSSASGDLEPVPVWDKKEEEWRHGTVCLVREAAGT